MRKHIFIPDTQVTPDSPTDHLEWIGEYIVDQQPDVIVQIGDFADMESLSSYDKGKKAFEGRRYTADIAASKAAMERLMKPINSHNNKLRGWKEKLYKPEMHLTLGNHENRISRAVEHQAELEGVISVADLDYEKYWRVHPFLQAVEVDGIQYAHYFYNQQSGRPFGGESIITRINKLNFTFSMGHQQVFMWGDKPLNNGGLLSGLVWGNCYLHDELYRGPQANSERRGIMVKHEVRNGRYDPMVISLDFLCRKYEGKHVWEFMKKKYPKIYEQSTWMQLQEAEWKRHGKRKAA